jgi:rSAM/selenodomain-associated transferase 1
MKAVARRDIRRGKRRLSMREPPLLAIMTKAPVCGAVKTRLSRDIGAVAAAALQRTLTAALLREAARDPRFRTALAVSPDAGIHAACWDGAPRFGQGRGGLGQRMQRIFDRCGRGPLIIVGADIPFITRDIIAEAFWLLRGADAVFGPAEDGGYWLVGLRRRPKILSPFNKVRWSSPHALADTLNNLRGHRVAFARTLFDIDTAADYRRYVRARSVRRGMISTKLQG